MSQNKILVLTTKGCESCAYLRRNLKDAISRVKNKIEVVYKDKSDMDNRWLKQHLVSDFPTMFFIDDDLVLNKYVGNYPASVIVRWIDINFNKY